MKKNITDLINSVHRFIENLLNSNNGKYNKKAFTDEIKALANGKAAVPTVELIVLMRELKKTPDNVARMIVSEITNKNWIGSDAIESTVKEFTEVLTAASVTVGQKPSLLSSKPPAKKKVPMYVAN